MVQDHDNHHAELIDLLVGLSRAAVRDTARLHDAMEQLKKAYFTDPEASTETLLPRLQIAFRTLSHSLLQIREQTDQLLRIAGPG